MALMIEERELRFLEEQKLRSSRPKGPIFFI
jgi:hypothetical protein